MCCETPSFSQHPALGWQSPFCSQHTPGRLWTEHCSSYLSAHGVSGLLFFNNQDAKDLRRRSAIRELRLPIQVYTNRLASSSAGGPEFRKLKRSAPWVARSLIGGL